MKRKLSFIIALILMMSMMTQTVAAADLSSDEALTLTDEPRMSEGASFEALNEEILSDEAGSDEEKKEQLLAPEDTPGITEDDTEDVNGYTDADFTYETNKTGLTVTGMNGEAKGTVTIPAVHDGTPVTGIGRQAFAQCTGITKLVIGSNITSIGEEAFYYCTNIAGKISFPAAVKKIGPSAFAGCSSLTGISLPEGLESLGYNAFSDCSSLKGNVVIPKSITEFGSNVFCRSGNGATVVFTEGLKGIGAGTFENSGFKGTIKIPASMRAVPDDAFSNSPGFTKVEFGKNVITIGTNAFLGCRGLSGTLTFPKSVTTIGDLAFRYCSGITKIKFSKNLMSIGRLAFGECTGITEISIPSKVNSISGEAFSGMFYVSKVKNDCKVEIHANSFIDNSGGGESYFVKKGSKKKINRDGMIGKGTFNRKVVKLSAPVLCVGNSSKGISLECNKVFGATKYIWQRSKFKYTGYKKIGSTKKPSFTDSKATEGKVYYYRVYATKSKQKSGMSEEKEMCRLKKVTLKSVTNSKADSMTVKWTKNKKADGYYIIYAKDKDLSVDPVEIKITKKGTVKKTISGLEKGQTYYVCVFAYKKGSPENYRSYRSSIKKVKIEK